MFCLKKFNSYSAFLLVLSVTLTITQSISPQQPAEWTVLLYIQGRSNDLSNRAMPNLKSVIKAMNEVRYDKNKVNFVTQWDKYSETEDEQPLTKRYRVLKEGLILEDFSPETDEYRMNVPQKIIDFVKWGVKHYPAKHYFLILWDHASGCLDFTPARPSLQQMYLEAGTEHQKMRSNDSNRKLGMDLQTQFSLEICTRTLMTDDGFSRDFPMQKAYLKNSDLEAILSAITAKDTLGKRLDVLGLDLCSMGSIEIACQAEDFVDYMVASENPAPAHGWNYFAFTKELISKLPPPSRLVRTITQTFGELYSEFVDENGQDFPIYTLSSVELKHMSELKRDVDSLSQALDIYLKHGGKTATNVIRNARYSSTELTDEFYVDLYSFCSNISQLYERQKQSRKTDHRLSAVERTASKVVRTLENAIVSKVDGSIFGKFGYALGGLSVYFPTKMLPAFLFFKPTHISPEYRETTKFGKSSLWSSFLEDHVAKLTRPLSELDIREDKKLLDSLLEVMQPSP